VTVPQQPDLFCPVNRGREFCHEQEASIDCKAYFGDVVLPNSDDATIIAAAWTEMTNVTDVNQNLETGEADATTRANNGWSATLATLKNGGVEFEMVWDTADAGFTKMQAAWSAGVPVSAAFMDGGILVSGSQGLVGNFSVTNFSRSEPLLEAVRPASRSSPRAIPSGSRSVSPRRPAP